MFTPLVLILAYLAATFLLGLVLGWLLWKFGGPTQVGVTETDVQYWKDRVEQSRVERNIEQDRITALERERDNLKKRLKAVLPSKSE